MKQQIEQLIDSLADKSLTFGCRILNDVDVEEKIIMASYHELKGYWKIKTDGTATMFRYVEGWRNNDITVLGHPILIGDVLERIVSRVSSDPYYNDDDICMLVQAWQECGLKKSLQEIIEASGWDTTEEFKNSMSTHCGGANQILKDPNARALIEFLLSLNLKNNAR